MPNQAHLPARILLIDDQPIVRLGVAHLIASDPDLTLSGEVDSLDEALRQLPQLRPDLAIVEPWLRHGGGLELIRTIHLAMPSLPLLALSARDEALFAERALRAGARAYLMKDTPVETLRTAIREVVAGHAYVSDRWAQSMIDRLGPEGMAVGNRVATLTYREQAVFERIGRGLSSAAIAAELNVSIKTVETYRANIKAKLGLRNAIDLLRYATACYF